MTTVQNPLEQARVRDPKSTQWYLGQIRRLGLRKISGQQALHAGIGTFAASPSLGSMYLFAYDPKTKETLPYYDTFPLVFPFAPAKGGFLGINLHYLAPVARTKFIKELMEHATTKNLTQKTRLRLSWGTLQRYSQSYPCVKHYLTKHVRSSFLTIDPRDWTTASLLPIEGFVGRNKTAVYKKSQEQERAQQS